MRLRKKKEIIMSHTYEQSSILVEKNFRLEKQNEYLRNIVKNVNLKGVTISTAKGLNVFIWDTNMINRAINILTRSGKKTLEDISIMTYEELTSLRGMGKVTANNVVEELAKYSVELRT